jgi:hypothetical protein
MPKVMISIQELQYSYYVLFMIDNKKIGRTFRFASDELVYEMLRRAHANLETMNIVTNALTNRRPVMVAVNLTDEQVAQLK